MNKEQEIGNLFKESLQGYQAEPPAGTWDAIAHDKTLLRFNRHRRIARIAKFAAVPAIATVAIVTLLLLSNGTNNEIPAVAPDPVTTTSSVANPSPAPLIVEDNTSVTTSQTPQQFQKPNDIIVPQYIDNQKETIVEVVTHPESASSPVEPDKPMELESYNPQNNHEDIHIEEDDGMPLHMVMPHYIQPEPKSGRSGQLTFSKDTSVCRNSQLTLYVHNAMEVHWNIGIQGETITLYPEESMLISATVTTYEKIDTTIYIHIGVFDCGLWIPTAFTPNGDGLNDEFIVHAPATISHYECAIYDRSRGLLFRTNNFLQGWDGTFNGKPLPLGAYFYIITYFDEAGMKHVETGQITLIR